MDGNETSTYRAGGGVTLTAADLQGANLGSSKEGTVTVCIGLSC